MTNVTLTGLGHTYAGAGDGAAAVRALTLEIAAGSLTALVGPSGCGKTTVMRMIAGLLAPDAGDIAFDGVSVLRLRPEARGAVMVFQNHLLFPNMNVAQNVGFGLRMRGVPRARITAEVARMLDLVRLPDLGARRPQELSGGQQQRVALARALIVAPRVLLLDEPLSNLDAHLRVEMRDLIRQIQRDTGITTVFVTHDQEEAVVLADRIALMFDGRLRQLGPPEDFYRRPADAEVARFFGGRNFIDGTVRGGVFDGPLGRLALSPGAPDGPATLTFRPEAVRLETRGIAPGTANTVAAVLEERLYMGTQTRLCLRVEGTRIEALAAPDLAAGLMPGGGVTLCLPPESLWILPRG